MTDYKELVLAECVELLRLADEGKVPTVANGICSNVDDALYADGERGDDLYGDAWSYFDTHVAEVIWPRWSKHSGDPAYPIPGGGELYWDSDNLWVGEQGSLRRELLQFTIKQLTEV